jgi:putative membrane protein
MYLSALLSSLHILGVALAFIGIRSRIIALRKTQKGHSEVLPVLFRADNTWGIAAMLLIATGLIRAFSGYEKGSAFYLRNTAFYIKVGVFALIFALEILPMMTLIRWRISGAKGRPVGPDELMKKSGTMRTISLVQAVLLVGLLFVAPIMARGLWMN